MLPSNTHINNKGFTSLPTDVFFWGQLFSTNLTNIGGENEREERYKKERKTKRNETIAHFVNKSLAVFIFILRARRSPLKENKDL